VTGLEPGTGFPNPRPVERAAGRVPLLKGGETYRVHLAITGLASKSDVAQAMKDIQALAVSAPIVSTTPTAPEVNPARPKGDEIWAYRRFAVAPSNRLRETEGPTGRQEHVMVRFYLRIFIAALLCAGAHTAAQAEMLQFSTPDGMKSWPKVNGISDWHQDQESAYA